VLCLKSSFLRYLLDWAFVYVPSFSFSNILDLINFFYFFILDTFSVVLSCILFMCEGFAFLCFQ
jgi:hypothetical protein